jgi:MFS family permease
MHVPASRSLWRHKDFLKLWTGETISAFGSQITAFALPLMAVLLLGATPVQMGILSFLAFAPMLFLTLFAGVLVDRLPRRPILIFTSLGQAIILGTLPLATLFGLLSFAYLYIVVFCCGMLTVFFEVAYQAYLPSLIEQEQMVEGNGKLEMSHALAQIAGSGLAGSIVQLFTAPLAIVLDAFSFLISATFLCCIRKVESAKVRHGIRSHIFTEIREGLQIVLRNRILWSIAACNATMNLFSSANASIIVLYVVHDLAIKPIIFGFITATGSIGALIGSLVAKPIAKRFGIGPTIIGSVFCYGIGAFFLPLAGGSSRLVILCLVLNWFTQNAMLIIFNVTQVSMRQSITPWHLQGRMNASMRFLICSALPLGSLLGGLLGTAIGLRSAILIGVLGMLLAFLWVLFSPLTCMRENSVEGSD